MKSEVLDIRAVPTNIITGFLGVGKTSTILHLLKSKPNNERWAVLVNEFGEIGIDGALVQGQQTEEQGVVIREVPGGCICCAAGLPMQIALNQLLAKAKPDRLLIEPTGLGHPKEVLQVLSSFVRPIKNPAFLGGVTIYGALGRIRTSDRSVRSRVLYPAELRVRVGLISEVAYYR